VAQARKLIAESLPHVVLLDWMLPDSSGLALLSELRRDQHGGAAGHHADRQGHGRRQGQGLE
jgi:DNA-binding response OmpR family regulator